MANDALDAAIFISGALFGLAGGTPVGAEMGRAMKIALAADHAGFAYKDAIVKLLREGGHEPHDFGTHDATPVDYPDYGFVIGNAVSSGAFERGILVCGSSIGIAIAANKVEGVRCAVVFDQLACELARRHNDANVLALSGRLTGWEQIERLVQVFLETPFESGEPPFAPRRQTRLWPRGAGQGASGSRARLRRARRDAASVVNSGAHHDVGGAPSSEPIPRDEHPLLPWEVRVDALMWTLTDATRPGGPLMTVDQLRRGIEELTAEEYRDARLFRKVAALDGRDHDRAGAVRLARRTRARADAQHESEHRDVSARYAAGRPVRVARATAAGHVRTPRYVRGKRGVVERICGAFRNPEELALRAPRRHAAYRSIASASRSANCGPTMPAGSRYGRRRDLRTLAGAGHDERRRPRHAPPTSRCSNAPFANC